MPSVCNSMCLSTTAGHLGEPVLLPVWFSVPGVHHPGGVLLADQHRHGLLSALCRGTGEHHSLLVEWDTPPNVWARFTVCSLLMTRKMMGWLNIVTVVEFVAVQLQLSVQWSTVKAPCSDFTLYILSQDYRWWWRTFLVSGGSAFYVLVYAVFYFINKVQLHQPGRNSSVRTMRCLRDYP